MEKVKYSEKLKDPRWQKKRLAILERDLWTCRWCGDKGTTLHVHHIFYLPGREPWNIPDGFLITLCERCHKLSDISYENPPHSILEIIGSLLDDLWKHDVTENTCLSSLEKAIHYINLMPVVPEDMK